MINFRSLFFSRALRFSRPFSATRSACSNRRRKAGSGRPVVAALVAGLLGLMAGPAHADLMINPTRIVFEKNKRSAQIDIINDGTTVDTYRITMVERRMLDTGEFAPVVELQAGEKSSKSMVVYSPHSVVLGPGMQQLVRVAVRKPENLEEGEYRSHMVFERVVDVNAENSIATRGKPSTGAVEVKISALIGVSIPVIVREGNPQASVALSHLALEKATATSAPVLTIEIDRSGARSVHGDFLVTFKTATGVEKTVGRVQGVSVYTPNRLRRARFLLQPGADTPLQQGMLTVTFTERPEDGGAVIARGELSVP